MSCLFIHYLLFFFQLVIKWKTCISQIRSKICLPGKNPNTVINAIMSYGLLGQKLSELKFLLLWELPGESHELTRKQPLKSNALEWRHKKRVVCALGRYPEMNCCLFNRRNMLISYVHISVHKVSLCWNNRRQNSLSPFSEGGWRQNGGNLRGQ